MFETPLILQFVQFREKDIWLFVGEYTYDAPVHSPVNTGLYYPETLSSRFSDYVGKLIVRFKKSRGPRQCKLNPAKVISDFQVLKVLPHRYDGESVTNFEDLHFKY